MPSDEVREQPSPEAVTTIDSVVSDAASVVQNINAAIARTAARTLALYFARPVRLFRPSKLSGWQMLRVHARSAGHSSLSPQYLYSLFRSQGFYVISHHFIPPLLVNAALGTILWSSFTLAQTELTPYIESSILTAGAAGSLAGTAQALAAAPAENVRILLEESVFRASESVVRETSDSSLSRNKVRELLPWVREIRDMAGTGWEGWRWTVAKDACGFAAFFMIFEVSRQAAAQARVLVPHLPYAEGRTERTKANTERVAYAGTLVAGGAVAGLCYEIVGRPFDNARHLGRAEQLTLRTAPRAMPELLQAKLRTDGILSFFRDPHATTAVHEYSNSWKQRLYSVSRVLARVGPWGIGFLVFESWSPSVK
ncbi:hypothetical protein BKA62DRAFT_695047 [Auriculariales sp. MPI-PUGE-AT-0066]|nr:hypothetical protein BKA62DRAFT_695047 [Auriculariales sp. MPI-PUGE-AT-0066]